MCLFAQHQISESAGSRQCGLCTVQIGNSDACYLNVRVCTGIVYFHYIFTCVQNDISQINRLVTCVILGCTCFIQSIDRSCCFIFEYLNAYEVSVVRRDVYGYIVASIVCAIHVPLRPAGQGFAFSVRDFTALNAPITRNDSVSVRQEGSCSVFSELYNCATGISQCDTIYL